jgi:hypothetical protein
MKTAILEFEEYPGETITVRLSPISLDDYEKVVTLWGRAFTRMLPKPLRTLYAAWCPLALVEWTFPEPADAKGIGARDANLGMAIVRRWIEEVRDVPLPLPARSSDGAASEDPSPGSPPPES